LNPVSPNKKEGLISDSSALNEALTDHICHLSVSLFGMEQINQKCLLKEKMAIIFSSLKLSLGLHAVHLQNWKSGEEIDLTFASENRWIGHTLVTETKAYYGSELKKIQMPTRTEISRSSFAFSFL
jgi:hypothetical protein